LSRSAKRMVTNVGKARARSPDADLRKRKLPLRLNRSNIRCQARIGTAMKGATPNEKRARK